MISYLQVESLTKSYGDLLLFSGISFGVGEGQRMVLIAKNGTGKSTLLNIIAGREECDSGTITAKRDLRVGYLPQEPQFPEGITVLEACFHCDNPALKVIGEYEQAIVSGDSGAIETAIASMDALNAWDYEQRAKQILSQLKIDNFDARVEHLSGGQLKRVALASVLISESDLLILDEPTNHLDLDMTQWLEEYLTGSRAALLMVTHDRYFLDRVCSDIIEMDANTIYTYRGNYSYYLEKREERIAASESQRESEFNLYRKELEWMRRQPQARATKAKARIEAFGTLESRVKSTQRTDSVQLDVKATRVGTKIFEAKNLTKGYDNKCLIRDFNYNFARYEKLGIVGNNGCGKSTFIKMLMGQVAPDSGTIDVGESVRFGYYSQQGLDFDENAKVIDVVTEIAEQIVLGDGRVLSASQFLQHFLFAPDTQHNFVSKLSGGERRRLYLCTILMQSPNFLVLDEPTNDLDITTLTVLEEYLSSYKGCLMVVSHDRYFMDKVVDHLLVFSGDGNIKEFAGNYTDYIDWKRDFDAAKRAELSEKKSKETQQQPSRKSEQVRKLSFKEKREMEQLEAEIPMLEAEKSALEQEMNSGTLSVEQLTNHGKRIGELIDLIDEKSMR